MLLRTLRIENFRAIRKTAIRLDDGTALIGENDCGISSVLDALELVLGHDAGEHEIPDYLFHRERGSGRPSGPIRIRLGFSERCTGEWDGEAFAAFHPLLPADFRRTRELWYETTIVPGDGETSPRVTSSLRSPGVKGKTSEPGLLGRLRRMNPVVRVRAGMLTGRGGLHARPAAEPRGGFKISPEVRALMSRINRAVDARLSGRSLTLEAGPACLPAPEPQPLANDPDVPALQLRLTAHPVEAVRPAICS